MGSYVSARRELEQLVKREGDALVTRTAHRVLRDAQEMVPQPGASRGFSLGSLKASLHVVTTEESGYGPAIDAAMEAPDTRILARSQIEPPENLTPEKHKSKALVVAPLSYAKLIHNGFAHVGGFRVLGTAFLTAPLYEHAEDFQDEVKGLIDLMKLLSPTTAAMRQQKQRDAFQARQMGSARSQVRQSQMFANQRLRAKNLRAFAPERGESMQEMQDRMQILKDEIIALGNLD